MPVDFVAGLVAYHARALQQGGRLDLHRLRRDLRHGWRAYARLCYEFGLIAQDAEHDGAFGKWYVQSGRKYQSAIRRFDNRNAS